MHSQQYQSFSGWLDMVAAVDVGFGVRYVTRFEVEKKMFLIDQY